MRLVYGLLLAVPMVLPAGRALAQDTNLAADQTPVGTVMPYLHAGNRVVIMFSKKLRI